MKKLLSIALALIFALVPVSVLAEGANATISLTDL